MCATQVAHKAVADLHLIQSLAWSDQEYFYSPQDGMLVHRRFTPSISDSPVPIYTPGLRETLWE